MAEKPSPRTFCWNELVTKDTEKSKGFYGELLGWTTQEFPMQEGATYTMFKNGDQQVGGMFKMHGPQFENVPPHWMSYICVENCKETTEKATQLGGKTVVPPTEVPEMGIMSWVQDPGGAVIAFWQPLN